MTKEDNYYVDIPLDTWVNVKVAEYEEYIKSIDKDACLTSQGITTAKEPERVR